MADWLRQHWLLQPFGCVRFWRFALVRPNDQQFILTAVHAEGTRLDLSVAHASHSGHATVLSVWDAQGWQRSGSGVTLQHASRLRWDDHEAWLDGDDQYRIRTPRGEGGFPLQPGPALTLDS